MTKHVRGKNCETPFWKMFLWKGALSRVSPVNKRFESVGVAKIVQRFLSGQCDALMKRTWVIVQKHRDSRL